MQDFIQGTDVQFADLERRVTGHVIGFADQVLPPGSGHATGRVAFEVAEGGEAHLMVNPVPMYTRPEAMGEIGADEMQSARRMNEWLNEGRTTFPSFTALRDWIRIDLAAVYGFANIAEGEDTPTTHVADLSTARRLELVAVARDLTVRTFEMPTLARAQERMLLLLNEPGAVSVTMRALAEANEPLHTPAWEALALARGQALAAEQEAARLLAIAEQEEADREARLIAEAAEARAAQARAEVAAAAVAVVEEERVPNEAAEAERVIQEAAQAAAAAAEAPAGRRVQPRFAVVVTTNNGDEVQRIEVSGRGRAERHQTELMRGYPGQAVTIVELGTPVATPVARPVVTLPTEGFLVTVRFRNGRRREITATSSAVAERRRRYYAGRAGVEEVTVLNYAEEARRAWMAGEITGPPPVDSWFFENESTLLRVTYTDGRVREIVMTNPAQATRRRAYYTGRPNVASAEMVVTDRQITPAGPPGTTPLVSERSAPPPPICYRSEDGTAIFKFRFAAVGNGVKIYIVDSPRYNGRASDAHASHRLGGLAGWATYSLCWTGRIANEAAARGVAAGWANRTLTYIRTGRRF